VRCTSCSSTALTCSRPRRWPGPGSAAIRAALDAARKMGEAFAIVLGHPDVLRTLRLHPCLPARHRPEHRRPGRGTDGADPGPNTATATRHRPLRRTIRHRVAGTPGPGSAIAPGPATSRRSPTWNCLPHAVKPEAVTTWQATSCSDSNSISARRSRATSWTLSRAQSRAVHPERQPRGSGMTRAVRRLLPLANLRKSR
jgi:hypothetical protein